MQCQRCKQQNGKPLEQNGVIFHICDNCAEELYQRLLASLPDIIGNEMTLGERVKICLENARIYDETRGQWK